MKRDLYIWPLIAFALAGATLVALVRWGVL